VRFGPVTKVREHETAYIDAVGKAERSIYVETQFLRHLPLADALAERGRQMPDLTLTIVLPTEPERVIFGANTGMDARHAQALQLRCLTRLRRVFGDRLAVVSPAQAWAAPEGTRMPVAGSGIIYLHSKVMLIDDKIGIVGSANLNGRSLLWDTEASVRFHDAKVIDELRTRLAKKWLRGAENGPIADAKTWMDAARAAEKVKPEDRKAMILPYPERRNRRFARYIPILPAAMF
jgi:phosphatidylserine/phosphatidylglycerophosphate/cardiolipin synthase-like enzyme